MDLLQVFQQPAERREEHLRELTHERRDLAFVHGVGHGDRVGDEQPDRGRRQHDADERDEREEADADALQGAHGTSCTILPNRSNASKRRFAPAASASGQVRSTTGVSAPVKKKRAARSSSPLAPISEPRIESRFANRACRSSAPWAPAAAPQVTRRPPRASERTLFGRVAPPTWSMTTSTPRRFVSRLISSATSCA